MKKTLGFTWDRDILFNAQPCDVAVVSAIFYSNILEFIRNDLHLDKTLIVDKDLRAIYQNISVGGYAVYELEHIRKNIKSNQKLYDLVIHKNFDLNIETMTSLSLPHIGDECKSLLDFNKGVEYIKTLPPYEGALVMGVFCLKRNFYRYQYRMTALQMMNGWLMKHGFEAISIPPQKLFELQAAFKVLYSKNDATDIIKLFDSCRRKQLNQEDKYLSIMIEIDWVLSKLNNDDMKWVNEYRELTFIHKTQELFIRIGETFNGINIEYDDGVDAKLIVIPINNDRYPKAKKLLNGIVTKLREVNIFNNLTSDNRHVICGETFVKNGAVDYVISDTVIPAGYRFVKSVNNHQYRLLFETAVGQYSIYGVDFKLNNHPELLKLVFTFISVDVTPTYIHKKAMVSVRLPFFTQLLSNGVIVIPDNEDLLSNMGFLIGVMKQLLKRDYYVYMADTSKEVNLVTDCVKYEDMNTIISKHFASYRGRYNYRFIVSKDEITDNTAYKLLMQVN